MEYEFTTLIHQEGKLFVALALELGVASQGYSVEEAKNNLIEAVELFLEDEKEPENLEFMENPVLTKIRARSGKTGSVR